MKWHARGCGWGWRMPRRDEAFSAKTGMIDSSMANVLSPAFRTVELRPAAPRDPQLVQVLGRILASGSDGRIAINAATGCNDYGVRAVPCPEALAFSSSTASTISPHAFVAVEAAYSALFREAADAGFAAVFETAVEKMRRELKTLLELDICDSDIVFSPSGTDSEIHALHLARLWHAHTGGNDIASIVVAAEETGSGVPLAAAGCHFNATTSAGAAAKKGQTVAGMDGIAQVSIPVRDGQGTRDLAKIDEDVSRAVTQAIKDGRRVVLHIMHHSKIGTRAPSAACIAELRAKHGMHIQFVLDACQFRLSRRKLRQYLDQGFLVLVTGSKFFAGPPLSGAVIVPEQVRARIVADTQIPLGLSDYATAYDWPESLADIRGQLPRRENLGQHLRWVAALAEMKAYFAVPELYRRLALGEFSLAVGRSFEKRGELELLPEPSWVKGEADIDDEFSVRTVFPFVVKRDGVPLSAGESRTIYRALNDNVCEIISCEGQERLAATICHIGQPVAVKMDGVETGALRIAVDARLVSECFADASALDAIAALKKKSSGVDVVLDKVALLTRNLDKLMPIYKETA